MSARRIALPFYGIAYLVFLYGPISIIGVFSFNDSIYIAFPFKGFTTRWYQALLENTTLHEALYNSLKVGIAVAIVSTIFGILAAKAVTHYVLPGRSAITAIIMLPMVIPSIIMGIALLVIVRLVFGLPLSLYTVAIGHTLLCIPLSMLVLVSRLEGFDKSLEEASLDLGESGWMTFWRVTFPLALPGVVASILLCFTTSFDEFVLAFFLMGNETTLPVFIYSQLRFPDRLPGVLALGSCITIGSILLASLGELARRHQVGSRQ